MYESQDQPLLSPRGFLLRLARHGLLALGLLVASLILGIVGYMAFARLNFMDAFLNASMILGGMGPVHLLPNDGAKLFAGLYALYSGVIFLVVLGVVAAPVLHRMLHRLHLDADSTGGDENGQS